MPDETKTQSIPGSDSSRCYVAFACVDNGSGVEWHETEESAIEDANQRIAEYRSESIIHGEWDDDVESVVVLKAICHVALEDVSDEDMEHFDAVLKST